jgi:hypothetical protein
LTFKKRGIAKAFIYEDDFMDGDPEYVLQFRFSVLEIADINESRDEVIQRESHWKSVLLTRQHGLNAN